MSVQTQNVSVGRRKDSVARVKVTDGTGKIIINDKPVDEYFNGLVRQRSKVLKPLSMWDGVKKYDFYVTVNGGGITGQSGAVSHSIARILLKLNPSLKQDLRKESFLTRDPRMVERKKPGRPKARKRFQFSKR